MGTSASNFACSTENRSNGKGNGKVSAETKMIVADFLKKEFASCKPTAIVELQRLLSLIPKDEDILQVYYDNGFNLLQKCVGENNVEAVKLILERVQTVERCPCSPPLHIACQNGYFECIEQLIEHGARLDLESPMCWPGPHRKGCPGIKNESEEFRWVTTPSKRKLVKKEGRHKRRNAMYYAVIGGQPGVLEILLDNSTSKFQCSRKLRPLLEVASLRGDWNCCSILIERRPEDIPLCKFLKKIDPAPNTLRLNLFHVLFFMVRKPIDFIFDTCKTFLENGLRSELNTLDSMGNTPLHSVIVRYAYEESRNLWRFDYDPWGLEETKEMVRFLIENGASASLNQPRNGIVSLIISHVHEWEYINGLVETVLQIGANPTVEGRDGRCPLMGCLFRLINEDLYGNFDGTSKCFYMRCIQALCVAGADPNCVIKSTLTPLHVLVFTAVQNLSSTTDGGINENFDFLRNVLDLLFQFGLNANAGVFGGGPNVFYGILKMVNKAKWFADMDRVHDMVLTLIQYGFNTNVRLKFTRLATSFYTSENPFAVPDSSHLLTYMFAALAKNKRLLADPKQTFARVLYLIYSSMDHCDLVECMNFLSLRAATVLPGSPCQVLCEIIEDMSSKPRTLKEMARLAIHKSVGRQLGLHGEQLPLPKRMQSYLINFEP